MKTTTHNTRPRRTVAVEAFTAGELRELHPDGFRNAHNHHVEWAGWHSEVVEDQMRESVLVPVSPELVKLPVFWSLSNCQGDGVSFGTAALSNELVASLTGATVPSTWSFGVDKFDHHYEHEHTFRVACDVDGLDFEAADAVADTLTEVLRDLCRKMKKVGYDVLDGLTSEDTFVDDSDGMLFDASGRTLGHVDDEGSFEIDHVSTMREVGR
jgi:hypothetical protein